MPHCDDRFSLLDQIPLGICILQSDYFVVFWNRCLEEWTKISRDRIRGYSLCEFFPHLSQPLYANRLAQIFAGGPPTIFSSQLHKHLIPATLSNGKNRIQHTTVTAIPASEGEGFYAMLSIQDVTDLTFRVQEYRQMRDQAVAEIEERKELEVERHRLLEQEQLARAEAERANRIKDDFLAVLSHELRSPLNPILGWAKLMQSRKFAPAETAEALATIERNVKLQIQLIDDLLDVAKILRGKLSIDTVPVNLVFVIEAAIDTVRTAAIAKSILLHPVLPYIGQVCGDATRLQQIVWNLLSNAVKFTPKGGQVEIRLEQVDDQAHIIVSDTGKGINPNFLPCIFETFRQEDVSVTRKFGGLGLGLAIVRQLVEAHGGTITADSPGEGLGATFTVRLPLLDMKPDITQTNKLLDSALDLTGLRVLAVDDEPDARELLTALLTQYGAEVLTVASAVEALTVLESFQPDALISDIGMPEIDGYTLIQQIRALPPEKGGRIPAIALTAYAREDDQQQAISSGYQWHITKPLEPEQLVRAVIVITGHKS